jgi:hypothetical protein
VRRGLAGLLFFIAAVCLALAAGGWYLQRVAFDTARSGDLARVVLRDSTIRAEIATVAAQATAQTLGVPPEQVQAQVDALAQSDAGADLMSQIVTDAHAKLIGERTAPVEITGAELVQLTRNEAVGSLPPVVLPVEEVGVLSSIREALWWAVPIAAALGAIALLLGIIAHPRKSDAVFGIGIFCILAGIVAFGLGYLVPVFAIPHLTDSVWVAAIPAIARYALPVVVVASIALVAAGLALMIAAAAARRRRAWSAPVPIRYGDQHRWS